MIGKLISRIFLKRFYRYPQLKTLYKGSMFKFKDVLNIYHNAVVKGNSCKIFGSEFYGLEKVNYYTLDEIFNSKVYEFETNNKKPIIIDCGANIGLSVLFFMQQHKDAIIYAFEPDSINSSYLEKNILSYGWQNNVFLHKKLVSDTNGFEYFESLGNAGSRISKEGNNLVKIEKIRLLEFLQGLNSPIDFLKIDIEGSEFQVIPDLKPVYSQIKKMYIEFHCGNSNFHEIFEFIEDNLGDDFYFQVTTNFTEDQNIYSAIQNRNSKTYYNCFAVNKN